MAAGEAAVEALALWVHLDPDGAHPRPLPDGFEAVYGATAAGRRVRARLRHPAAPPDGAPRRPWRFRAADLDLAGHVNNAVYWQVLEEELVPAEPVAAVDAEIEYRAPGGAGRGRRRRRGRDALDQRGRRRRARHRVPAARALSSRPCPPP